MDCTKCGATVEQNNSLCVKCKTVFTEETNDTKITKKIALKNKANFGVDRIINDNVNDKNHDVNNFYTGDDADKLVAIKSKLKKTLKTNERDDVKLSKNTATSNIKSLNYSVLKNLKIKILGDSTVNNYLKLSYWKDSIFKIPVSDITKSSKVKQDDDHKNG